MISDECYDLATGIFKTWVFIDAARRYAIVEEKEKALTALVNARAIIYDAESQKALTESEAKALRNDTETVIALIEAGNLAPAKEQLSALSEQVFMSSLQKVVECECKGR